ncbi:MAG: helix-turn-helix domain-containing protein [Syntrophorhabdaceae bacterium]|nr:helix-turn-helix domain-containing protein [Syntrophorhabdaceae bacterium]
MEQSNYSKIFKALSSEQRLKIFLMIYKQCCAPGDQQGGSEFKAGGDKLCCAGATKVIKKAFSHACDCMKLSRSTISHHFKELQNAGLITCEREGRTFRCKVNDQAVKAIRDFLK